MTDADTKPGSAWDWWPLALTPLALALAIVAHILGWSLPLSKAVHENVALGLTGAAVGAYAMRYRLQRLPWHLLLTGFAIVVFCREWHFPGTDKGVYVGVIVIVIAGMIWRKRLWPAFASRPFVIGFISTVVAYVLAVLIARRVFKEDRLPLLPWEQELHVGYEELAESVAHMLLLITAFVGCWKQRQTPPAPASTSEDEAMVYERTGQG